MEDIEHPFCISDLEKRVYKIDITCHDTKPSTKMTKTKPTFKEPEFWYMKGHEHYHTVNESESAIDSYRQAIRLNPYFVNAIHNLACSYEI
jgi:hypothetical protein